MILLLAPGAWSQDRLSVLDLGDRGVVIESAIHGDWGTIHDVTGVGDVDGDGFDDLVALQYIFGVDGEHLDLATLIYGRPALFGTHILETNLPRTAVFQLPGATQQSVAPAGDVNGDGHADFFFGQPYHRFDAASNGTGLLVYGSAALEGDIPFDDLGGKHPAAKFWSSDTNSRGVGRAQATIGDFDGDGRVDVAVAAPFYPKDGFEVPDGIIPGGRVHVVLGVRDVSPVVDLAEVGRDVPGMFIQGPSKSRPNGPFEQWGFFGIDLAPAGDFDGDGFDDFLVAQDNFIPRTYFLIHGRRDPPGILDLNELDEGAPLEGVTRFVGPANGNPELGDATGGEDFNGDGLADIAIGIPKRPGNPFASGWSSVSIFYGRSDFPTMVELAAFPPPAADVVFRAMLPSGAFGTSLAAGDFNGDGIPDLLVGADRADVRGRSRAGAAFVIDGKRGFEREISLVAGFDGIHIEGGEADTYLGDEVASAGDFNGDGTTDSVVLASSWSPMSDEPSRIYVIYGTRAESTPLRLSTVEPDFGAISGGVEVILSGSGFDDLVEVRFGAEPAARIEVLSATRIRAVTPPVKEPGVVDVTVTAGGETVRRDRAFEYIPDLPQIRLASLGAGGLIVEGRAGGAIGRSLAIGDITGDGIGELVVASSLDEANRWLVSIIEGRPDLPAALDGFEPGDPVTIVTTFDRTGPATASVIGDVNGDGLGDLGIAVNSGHGFVVFGREKLAGEELLVEDLQVRGAAVRLEHLASRTFYSIAPVGDLTGDGIGDLAVALADGAGGPSLSLGAVVLVAGREFWPEILDIDVSALTLSTIVGSSPGMELGRRLRAAGDVNGDGLVDLLVATAQPGKAYLIYGRPDFLLFEDIDTLVLAGLAVSIEVPGGSGGSLSIPRIAGPGDVNGDGLHDLLIGIEGGGAVLNQGVSYLIYGRRDLPAELTVTDDPPSPGVSRFLGEGGLRQAGRVGPAGDFNGDGHADFLIATQGGSVSAPAHVSMIFGGETLPDVVDLRRLGALGVRFTVPDVATASIPTQQVGDLNGDGLTDFGIVQSTNFAGTAPGRIYVVYGLPHGETFVRGDANSDGAVNLTDALYILEVLFFGGDAPRCEDAADADDSGGIAITDAVRLLQHLFQGGAGPPLPYPEAGEDPTEDALGCGA